MRSTLFLTALLVASACGEEARPPPEGAGGSGGDDRLLFGIGTPQLTPIADRGDGLDVPRDLGFHPGRTGELWIVNRADDSVTIVFDATSDAARSEHRIDAYAKHFMEEVSSIAFGARNFEDDWTFGTCQESENTYDHQADPNLFMGPALWSASLEVFARRNPIGLGSHLDMLHHSPDCMGIAHESDNAYWVFDGYNGRIARYDFREDHDSGYDDHSDGVIRFLDEPSVARVPDVPSHLALDHEAGVLYVADTGNRRVLRIETEASRKVRDLRPIEPGTVVEEWTAGVSTELVPGSAGLELPSGLALHGGVLYVGDNATGEISAYDAAGSLLGILATGLPEGALMGIEVGPDERLYFADAAGDRVLRVER